MSIETLEKETIKIRLSGLDVNKLLGEDVRPDPKMWTCPVNFSYSLNHGTKIVHRKEIGGNSGLFVYEIEVPPSSKKEIIERLERAQEFLGYSPRIVYSVLQGKFPRGNIGEIKETEYN